VRRMIVVVVGVVRWERREWADGSHIGGSS